MRSIERTLLVWILGALSLGALAVALATYVVVLNEMNEVYDADLRNVAEALGSYRPFEPAATAAAARHLPQRRDVPDDAEIVTLTWTPDGRRVYASDPRVAIPFSNTEALTRTRIGGVEWIVYTDVSVSGVAQAAQRGTARRETAAEAASKIFPPMIGLAVVLTALMVIALRHGLRPVDRVARAVAERSARSLAPMATDGVPREILPLMRAINGLLRQLAEALSVQRRFVADAAHALRTPVTALQLQLQLLARSTDETTRREATSELEAGIARTRRLVEQLLQVARAEPDAPAASPVPVDLGARVRAVVAALGTEAGQRGIELGAAAAPGITVTGDAHQIDVLLVNLVENALRYTPRGGLVDVQALRHAGRAALRVIDNGPGIPPAERERVFDRFYRGEGARAEAGGTGGSGLGLAIVRAIAERHDARVSLLTPACGRGLEVLIVFGPGLPA
jgi:signal transduction histidine kinase